MSDHARENRHAAARVRQLFTAHGQRFLVLLGDDLVVVRKRTLEEPRVDDALTHIKRDVILRQGDAYVVDLVGE